MTGEHFLRWIGIVCIAAVALGPAAHAGERRALIELFTSQGCSSCPPADHLLGELSQDASLVTLSLPIDYWDYLGWKDTLALPSHAARQRGYATSRGDRQVYTPQAVVNGVLHALGSDKGAIEQAIVQSDADSSTMAVPVKLAAAKGRITVDVAAAQTDAPGVVWLCGVEKTAQVHIGRGENRGKTVTYHNVVRGWHKLGEWRGKPVSWDVSRADLKPSADEVAVIIEERPGGHPGRVLGAAIIPLRD